jgi:S1-C subfamily serine protease
VATDATNDLALLRSEHHWATWARFHDDRGLKPREAVVATGFPLSGLVSSEMAVTTGSLTALAGYRGDTRQLEFSAPIQPGNSGGSVLDSSGRVIGVTVAMLNGPPLAAATGTLPENVNFAIKTTAVRGFLDAHQVSVDANACHPGLTPPEIGDLARGFTVKVECWR